MPYIICVNRPGFLPEQEPYAVATLEEAREAAANEVERYSALTDEQCGWDLSRARSLPEGGAVIGPMPDGYVIEVRAVSWDELRRLAGDEPGASPRADAEATPEAVLDAYNAASGR